MVSKWPRQQAQTQSALKKKRPLEDKILAAIEKRVSHIEEMLKPAAENSSVSRNIMKEAEETAQAVAKVCFTQLLMCYWMSIYNFFVLFFPLCVQESKAILTQAKHTRTASAHLNSHIHSALRQMAEQKALTDAANSQMTPEVLDRTVPHWSVLPVWDIKTITSCFVAWALPDQHKGGHRSRQAWANGLLWHAHWAHK